VLQGASKAQQFKASLWIPYEPPTGGKAANVAAATAAKAAVRAAMKSYNVKELWTDPAAPIVVVEGTAADLLKIGATSDVGRAALHDDSYKVQALAVGDADEKVDMGFPTLEYIHGDMVSGSIKDAATGLYIACATSYDNNYEMLDVDCPGQKQLEFVRIPVWGTGGRTARVGYALYVLPK
jgi:hypothetical protein